MNSMQIKARPVTGLSVASCIGNDLDSVSIRLNSGQRGLHTKHRLSDQLPVHLGTVDHSKFENEAKTLGDNDSLMRRMVVGCVRELSDQSTLFSRYKPEDIGIFVGTTTAGLEFTYLHLCDFFTDAEQKHVMHYLRQTDQHGVLLEIIRSHFPIKGFGAVISTACSAGAAAIAEAKTAIDLGLCKVAIAGGFDILTSMTMYGFDSLQVLDHSPCKPFTAERKGMNLSEGGAFFLIEKTSSLKPLAWLSGTGASNDIYHMTHPDPCGSGMKLCVERALENAGMTADKIDYVNPHGTGTVANDAAESKAMLGVFGQRLPLVSTKSYHGHALAGAGPLEAAICIAAIKNNASWQNPADMLVCEPIIPTMDLSNRVTKVERALSNSFGFGGNNISLIFSASEN